jgi:hypothetical protein
MCVFFAYLRWLPQLRRVGDLWDPRCRVTMGYMYIDGVRQCCASMYANKSERESTGYAQCVGTGSCTILFGRRGDPFNSRGSLLALRGTRRGSKDLKWGFIGG